MTNKCEHKWDTTRVEDAHSKTPLNKLSKCSECGRLGVQVIVLRVGREAVLDVVPQNIDRSGAMTDGHLDGMQALCGGNVEVVYLADDACPGLELWCNEDGMGLGLIPNRAFGATPRTIPPGFEDAFVIKADDNLAEPGEPGEWRIFGDFFLARTDDEGGLAPTNDADLAWARQTFRGEDAARAEAMDAMRPSLGSRYRREDR